MSYEVGDPCADEADVALSRSRASVKPLPGQGSMPRSVRVVVLSVSEWFN